MTEETRRQLAGQMVRNLPRYGRWAFAVRDFETPYGKIGFRQASILWALRYNLIPGDDATASDFANHLEVQPSVVTRVLAKLESNEFIDRTVDPNDGRRYRIQITEKGTRVSEFVEELFVQELLAGVSSFDDEQIEALTKHVAMLTDVVLILEENRRQRGIVVGIPGVDDFA